MTGHSLIVTLGRVCFAKGAGRPVPFCFVCGIIAGTMTGKLYVISTPIGNLEDVTLRALRILGEVDIIAAEDTRVTRKLLNRYNIPTPAISYHQHSRGSRTQQIVDALKEGKNVGLVTDAGTPGISDPGYDLISLVIEEGIAVECIPGPSAIIAALSVSGLPTARFCFLGFPPRPMKQRKDLLARMGDMPMTMGFYEAGNRLTQMLEAVRDTLGGDRQVVVAREVTKLFEEFFRGTAEDALTHFSQGPVKGEVVLLVAGAEDWPAAPTRQTETKDPMEFIRSLLAEGVSERDAVKRCATELGLQRRSVYQHWLSQKDA